MVVDERSAGFYALGTALATRVPAVVLCTSGSAAAHLHPAVVEADGCPDARFVSNLVDCHPEDATIGMSVHVVWHHVNDALTLPFWAPS